MANGNNTSINNNYNNNSNSGNASNKNTSNSYATTGGKNPKQIHIAHRRSPSELTSLMIEQFTLQRQLEYVQAQQQQILSQQQQQHQQQQSGYVAQPPQFQVPSSGYSPYQPPQPGHKRTGSNSHKRSQSSVTGAMGSFSLTSNTLSPVPTFKSSQQGSALGHNRRHSLGLNEAKKAAAQVQAQRAGKEVPQGSGAEDENAMPPPSGFKFPSTVIEPPQTPRSSGGSGSDTSGHGRSRSAAHSPQRGYQFPPKSPQLSSVDSLAPPQQLQAGFSYHERRQSGHNRSNSRNYDPNAQKNMNMNWRSQQRQHSPSRNQTNSYENTSNSNTLELPQPNFTPGHRSRGSHGGNSVSSLSGFQLPGQVGGRKSLFAPYLPQSSIPELVAEGRLVIGTLRVNKKNRSDAYVSTDGLLDSDIFICGSKDRNRALEGDLVAVELLLVDEVWGSKKEKEEKKRRKDNTAADVFVDDVHNDASTHTTSTTGASSNNDSTETSGGVNNNNSGHNNSTSTNSNSGSLQRKGSLKQRPTLKKNDDVEVEGQSLLLVEEEEINDEYKPLYAGHVVAVIDRIPGQLFAGTLGLLRPSQMSKEQQQPPTRPKIVWFKPTDKKVPLIAIPTEQAPKDFVENHDKYSDKVFVASIKRWPITSLHPFGTLISELGPMNDPNTEVDAILRDNNFLCDEYLNDYGEERSDFEVQKIDFNEEFAKRRNFTDEYVLAVSETGEFTDHSFHVKRISNEKIELGLHIADVTAFVKEGSLLDKKARKRSSSVFLAQKTVHLLPKSVNDLISFKKNEKSLALSVVFEIDTSKFEVDNVWVGESFIQPKTRLTYDQIDSILSGGDNDEEISSASKDYIKTVSLISREFRRQRLENSKLTNDVNLTLIDQIDDEKVRLNLNLFEANLSYSIINEIFLKVNSTVAQKIYATLGDSAFLRRQTIPTLHKLETFKRRVENFKVEIDTTSSAKLINSIIGIEDQITRQCVEILFFKCLTRSKYFIAGKVDSENFGSFYLNLPLFTHFTSPLRRYSDFIVHRQLKSILQKDTNNGIPLIHQATDEALESLKITAEYCNFKKDCAKNSQDQSIHLLLSQTINEMSKKTGQLIVMGTVLQVYESAFDIYLPEFGIEKRVHGDQLPLKKAEFDRKNSVLELYWEKGIDSGTFIPFDEREPLSYRNSIKNKFKTTANDVAKIQKEKEGAKNEADLLSNELLDEFKRLKINPPSIQVPNNDENELNIPGVKFKKSSVDSYLKNLSLRVEGDYYIQEIHELSRVPILLRAEIGMALPCLTVHALNPFTNAE